MEKDKNLDENSEDVESNDKEVEVEPLLNRETGELPFAYFHPQTDGKLIWICNYDAEGKITSVFSFKQVIGDDRKVCYLEDIKDAEQIRDELIANGWKKLKPPKLTFTYPGEKEGKPLNRRQRRLLQKKIKRLQKKNPFEE